MTMRPCKDKYYLDIAQAVSERSTCIRRHYGIVIVNNDEIIATGYNGNPRGMKNCCEIGVCSKEDVSHNSSPDSYNVCRSVHAEMNALMSARRSEMIGATLYIYGFDVDKQLVLDDPVPCPICLRMIQNSGIARIVNGRGDVRCMY
nr:MAG TPA: Deoxycytidylate deaminase [Caudoviricetes sp.]